MKKRERRFVVYGPRIGERPNLEGLDPNSAAEVLLRAGVLTGILGSKNQIADAHETAKNLITESLTIFESALSKEDSRSTDRTCSLLIGAQVNTTTHQACLNSRSRS